MVVLNIQTKEDKENEKIDQFSKLRVKISIKINPWNFMSRGKSMKY